MLVVASWYSEELTEQLETLAEWVVADSAGGEGQTGLQDISVSLGDSPSECSNSE